MLPEDPRAKALGEQFPWDGIVLSVMQNTTLDTANVIVWDKLERRPVLIKCDRAQFLAIRENASPAVIEQYNKYSTLKLKREAADAGAHDINQKIDALAEPKVGSYARICSGKKNLGKAGKVFWAKQGRLGIRTSDVKVNGQFIDVVWTDRDKVEVAVETAIETTLLAELAKYIQLVDNIEKDLKEL